jgi:hypothetical protein
METDNVEFAKQMLESAFDGYRNENANQSDLGSVNALARIQAGSAYLSHTAIMAHGECLEEQRKILSDMREESKALSKQTKLLIGLTVILLLVAVLQATATFCAVL